MEPKVHRIELGLSRIAQLYHRVWQLKQYFKPVIRNGGYMSTVVAERHTSDIRIVASYQLNWRSRKQMASANTFHSIVLLHCNTTVQRTTMAKSFYGCCLTTTRVSQYQIHRRNQLLIHCYHYQMNPSYPWKILPNFVGIYEILQSAEQNGFY